MKFTAERHAKRRLLWHSNHIAVKVIAIFGNDTMTLVTVTAG